MTSFFDAVRPFGQSAAGGSSAVEILLRVTLLLAATMFVAVGLRRSSAALRHMVLALSLLGTLLIPLFSWSLPAWHWAILPQRQQAPAAAIPAMAPASDAIPSVASATEPLELPPISLDVTAPTASSVSQLPSSTWSWPLVLAVLWAVGTSLGFVWLAIGVVSAWHVARRAQPAADGHWHSLLRQLVEQYRCRRPVEVRQCRQVSVPMTWGLRRPVILIPANSDAWSEATKRSVLLHELGHVRRGDCLMHLLGRLACAAYWFHPLVWLAARLLRRTSEQAADDAVLSSNIAPPDYALHLIGIAAQARGVNLLGHVALPMATRSDLEGRVLAILDSRRNHRSLKRKTCYALSLAAVALLVPCALLRLGYAEEKGSREQATAEATNSDAKTDAKVNAWQPGQVLDFHVINAKTKEPLAGVRLDSQFHGPGIDFQDIKVQKTDANGRAEIRLPDLRPDAVRVYPSKPGFVPMRVYWGDDLESPKLPKNITVPMEPGTVWGGVVQNENGEPIPNVKVNVRYCETGSSFNPHLRANIDDDIEGVATDEEGRWRMDILPARFTGDGPRLFLTHPDYVSDHLQRGMSPWPVAERPSYESLRNQTAVTVMRKGTTIAGRVTDESGKAISKASVCNVYDCYDPDPLKITTTTDDDGHFRLSGLSHRQNYRDYFFTVQAAGFAPVFVEVTDANAGTPVNIVLKRGQAVQGQVVDENGKPLEGVSIKLDYWMGHPRQFFLKTTTDAAGKFRIDDAPPAQMEYDFEKSGYIIVRKPLPPSSEDYRVTLRPPLGVSGTILDAETNRPLDKCTLTKGTDYEDGRAPQWYTFIGYPVTTITDGRYQVEFTRDKMGMRIRVEADGYMPAVSRIFKPGDVDKGLVNYDFKLTKASPMTGTVRGQDGKPLEGADVYRATDVFAVDNGKPSSQSQRNARTTQTDASGRFELPPEVEPFYLVVLHDQGFAVVKEDQFAGNSAIRIEPWTAQNRSFRAERRPSTHPTPPPAADAKGAIAVRVVDTDGKPVEGAVVATIASYFDAPNTFAPPDSRWNYSPNVRSNRNGMAWIADPYNRCIVARHAEKKLIGMRSVSPEQITELDTVTVTMHPQCKIFGKLTAKELESRNHKLGQSHVYLYLDDGIGRPMLCTSENADFHFYAPPGNYRLNAYAAETQHVDKRITVEPGQQELEVETIDLPPTGLVLLEGKPAPELRDITAWKNGGPVKLANLRGKVVILAFSTQWSGDRMFGIVPSLFPLYDKYHDQGLVIVDIRLGWIRGTDTEAKIPEMVAEVKEPFWKDRDIPIPIALVVQNQGPFRAGEKPKRCPVLEDYGIVGIPTGVLIDRQGRVVGQFDPRSPKFDDKILEKVLNENVPMENAVDQKKDSPRAGTEHTPKESERAVAGALNWLSRHQDEDGKWSRIKFDQHCKGAPCSGRSQIKEPASEATGLALLAFLAAGQTHKAKGPYQACVRKGLEWLVKQQEADGDLSGKSPTPMHAHAIATIALCNAYGMTDDPLLKEAAQKAVEYIERAQNQSTGGWRYEPKQDTSDTTEFGWQMMALKSAQCAGLEVAPGVFVNARKYLRTVAKGEHLGLYSYTPNEPATPEFTAIGMLCSQYLGAKRDDPAMQKSAEYLLANLPSLPSTEERSSDEEASSGSPKAYPRNTRYWLFGALAMYNYGGADGDTWNRTLRRILIESQIKEGCAAGSWDPAKPSRDLFGHQDGRLTTTCLSVLALEPYYRYLPVTAW